MIEKIIEDARQFIVELVKNHQGLKGIDLELKVKAVFLTLKDDEYLKLISELTQSNEIERFEYQLKDNRSQFLTFYLPQGSRLV